MQEIKLNLRPNLLRLFRHLSAIILNYLNQFRKRSNVDVSFYNNCLIVVWLYNNLQPLISIRNSAITAL
ncbi:Uncharacterised protein [Orientia tsutsugamushi]|uniref:Uncharacterized protein n=1 Tax=Orientia tsutsugamushi TaxID=784 RepID=A0A2U3RNL8_ORITS|nr:hypothetical protein OTSKARP_0753 [Orientia tsutsugamushi str. Karp]SPR14782.1 Uncharacterised protein [Orientia tsutsugamushi]